MKRIVLIGFFGVVAFSACSQHAQGSLVASVSDVDRLSIVKNSINIPAWHEKTFWPLYEDYLSAIGEVSFAAYRSLDELAQNSKKADASEAFEYASMMIGTRKDMLTVRARYYAQIGGAFNGIIALQFLQTEALLDMMESSRVYENSIWKKYRFHPKAMNPSQFKTAKHNTLTIALSLPADQSEAFWDVYTRYEDECDMLLGEDYSVISLYAGEPTDFTPALAKRLGNDFLKIMQRELSLKEKYFAEMNKAVGPVLAARFLAWEDYYSLISKMHAWAEN